MHFFYSLSLYSFLLAIIFFRLPNIYFLPFVTSGIFTTQAIARVLLIVVFFGGFFIYKRSFFQNKESRIITILLLCFFLSSSLSIIATQNLDIFFTRYKDLVIGIMAFFVFQYFIFEKKKIVIALLITIPFNIVYQLVLLYGENSFLVVKNFIYEKHFELVYYNLKRGRIYMDVYDEAFLPLLFLFLDRKKKLQFFLVSIPILFIAYLAFMCNFRTRILMFFLGFFGSLAILGKISIKRILMVLVMVSLFGSIVIIFFSNSVGLRFYDRFLLSNQAEDISSIKSRYWQIDDALEMGITSPFGVGLGNYYDNMKEGKGKSVYDAFSPVLKDRTAHQYIHNNFAMVIGESGYISFFFYCLLMIKFAQIDYKTLKEKDNYKKSFVISFWLLFFFGLLNPPIPGSYQILFWGVRGLLM